MTVASRGLTAVMVVWGEWHTNVFLRIALPTLLAPTNLPALAATVDLRMEIVTTPEDADRICAGPLWPHLARIAKIQFITTEDLRGGNPITIHQRVWSARLRQAAKRNDLALLLPPDVAWADGSFGHFAALIRDGVTGVCLTFPRVLDVEFAEDLVHRYPQSIIATPPGDLVRLTLTHLHPLTRAYFRNSTTFPDHAEMIVWPVGDDELLIRVPAREMFILDPATTSLTPGFLPDGGLDGENFRFIVDSDHAFGASLAPPEKDSSWYDHAPRADAEMIGRWWQTYDCQCRDLVNSPAIRWHTGASHSPRWQRADRAAELFMRKAALFRDLYGLWLRLNVPPFADGLAAKVVALLIVTGFRGTVLSQSSREIFVPTRDALQAAGERLSAMDEPAFIAMIANHVAARSYTLDQADGECIQTLGGIPISRKGNLVQVGEVAVLDTILANGWKIHLIDQILSFPLSGSEPRPGLSLQGLSGRNEHGSIRRPA